MPVNKSIGLVELSSVAAGFVVTDTMLKAGNVRLLLARSICSGKYMVLIGGETAGVEAAVAAGCEAADGCLIDSFVAPNVHPDVFVALGRTARFPPTARWASWNRSMWPRSSLRRTRRQKRRRCNCWNCDWPWRSAAKPFAR